MERRSPRALRRPRRARDHDSLAALHGDLDLELGALLVHQPEAERAVDDHARIACAIRREQLVEVEHRRDVAPDLGQRLERVGVAPHLLEQLRVDDADGDVRRELAQQLHVGGRELVLAMAENVERADRPLLVQQRDDELGRHAGHDGHITRVGRHVVHEQRHLARDRRAHQALARLEPHRRRRFRVPDRVGDAQIRPAVLAQIDGEGVELDQPRDQFRDLREKLGDVEDAGNLPAEVDQCRERFLLTKLWGKHSSALDYTDIFMEDRRPARSRHHRADLPHRYPLLLVDRITELEIDKRIVGIKNVTLSERTLSPGDGGRPALPPTILTEAIAQVGAILILAKPENRQRLPFFAGIERVRYRRPVHPGDVVVIEAVVKRLRSRMGVLHGIARVDGKVAVEGTMTFALGPARAT